LPVMTLWMLVLDDQTSYMESYSSDVTH
jgi:hypothetical protein